MTVDGVERVRAVCLGLPEVEERPSHGEPGWFVRGKKLFAMGADHHHDDRVAIWAAAPAGVQEHLVATGPERYFRPPYVGHRGWVGVYLDVPAVDWPQVEDLLVDAYCLVAPRALRDAVRPPEG
ncbi:MmcQ/YjbR family DNA-binding protein [Kitasatospora terrestris]|uniref:MmcQ/YjbR family DNA-binding protein n=1 Tax=Kitasatospora terrestris TaxID=258051 RepID=A0ABP9DEM5_9ACTN